MPNLRNPTLSRKTGLQSRSWIARSHQRQDGLRAAIYKDEATGLEFLPAVIDPRLAHSSEILASEAFKHLIDELRKSYDYVIIDLPPWLRGGCRATTRIIDSYVFVIAWGRRG